MASGDSETRTYRKTGNFKNVIRNISDITFENFKNPWNFFNLFFFEHRQSENQQFLARRGYFGNRNKMFEM